ncbi:Metallo-dependent phosphatase [Amniculicola lignicola CBS 123094]|uniref:Metallo-dependent phosphatase n=1 Tax=Amniculicola lignicola CBS 123094 TaxID=1392246 RepID=A0A6A5WJ44_9PLEO|nr:Metallo-dependent phosphatase [Amniculicola lignicola CBS 123094]
MSPPPPSPSAEEQVVFPTGDNPAVPDTPPHLRLLHYNDVYHIDASSAEPVGGIARFMTLVNYYREDGEGRWRGRGEGEGEEGVGMLTFFSGDAFNPSLESSVTKGAHMVPILNGIGTDVACVGNHDLDFGVKQYRNLTAQCTFPWLLANVFDPALGDSMPLGGAKKTVILTASNGIKVGVIGLAEREWLDTINALPPGIIYKSASATAKELIPGLREQGAEIIIAVTHQREPNDNKLADLTGGEYIDIILGGHDHYYNHSFRNGTHVLRSGTDFKQLSHIEVWRKTEGKGWDFRITRRDVVGSVEKDKKAMEVVDKLTRRLREKLDKPIGYTAAPLDARFTTVRTKESNLGNFVCDLMRYYYSADCCIMAAGTIRGDQIYPPGVLRLKDIVNCFPFEDPVVVMKVTGKAIREALENGVSSYPSLEGRFPQVSNISFEVDYTLPPMSRVLSVKINNEPLDPEREYVLATRGYMGRGKDGYTSLLIEEEGGVAKEIVSEENGVLISTILRQYFMSLKILGKWKQFGGSMERVWGGVQNNMAKGCHTFVEPKRPALPHRPSPTSTHLDPNTPSKPRARSKSPSGHSPSKRSQSSSSNHHRIDGVTDSDDDEDDMDNTQLGVMQTKWTSDELSIIRKVMRKWWRLAGLPGLPGLVDEIGEGEFCANWTKAVSPRVEGRIREVKREG